MSDPILAFKWFCLFLVLGVILNFFYKWAVNYRISYGKIKLIPSRIEEYLLIVFGIDCLLGIGCLLWTVIAWIKS